MVSVGWEQDSAELAIEGGCAAWLGVAAGLGRVFWSREGGNVGVVPGTACGGVQNRPPVTVSPS